MIERVDVSSPETKKSQPEIVVNPVIWGNPSTPGSKFKAGFGFGSVASAAESTIEHVKKAVSIEADPNIQQELNEDPNEADITISKAENADQIDSNQSLAEVAPLSKIRRESVTKVENAFEEAASSKSVIIAERPLSSSKLNEVAEITSSLETLIENQVQSPFVVDDSRTDVVQLETNEITRGTETLIHEQPISDEISDFKVHRTIESLRHSPIPVLSPRSRTASSGQLQSREMYISRGISPQDVQQNELEDAPKVLSDFPVPPKSKPTSQSSRKQQILSRLNSSSSLPQKSSSAVKNVEESVTESVESKMEDLENSISNPINEEPSTLETNLIAEPNPLLDVPTSSQNDAFDVVATMKRLTDVAVAAESDIPYAGNDPLDEETLELVYDVETNAYFDPKTGKYYQIEESDDEGVQERQTFV
jgi:hypothetical protein